jgi:hypothetical protein
LAGTVPGKSTRRAATTLEGSNVSQRYTARQLAALELPGLSRKAHKIRVRANAKGWPHTLQRRRDGRGWERTYDVTALPEKTQAALLERQGTDKSVGK